VQDRSPRLILSPRRLPEPARLEFERGKGGVTPVVTACVRPGRAVERRDRPVVVWRPILAPSLGGPRSVVSFPHCARNLAVVLPRRAPCRWGGPASPRSILAPALQCSSRAAVTRVLTRRGKDEAIGEDSWRSLRELVGAVLGELRPAPDRKALREEGRYIS
jgi:hypothetical protein